MLIEVLNRQLLSIGAIEKITSLQWKRRFIDCGEFELYIPFSLHHLEILSIGNYIVLRNKEECGVILYRRIEQSETGQEFIVVMGKMTKELLHRRIIWGTEYLDSVAGYAIKKIVENHCINPADKKRIIPLLKHGSFVDGAAISHQASYVNVMDECEKICLLGSIGYEVALNYEDKCFYISTLQGEDRSIAQNKNSPVVFSDEYENVTSQTHTKSAMDFTNVVLVGGCGEGKDRILVQIGDSNGLDRFEIFDDQRGLSKVKEESNEDYTDAEYETLLIGKGESTLKERNIVESFTFKNAQNSNFEYLKDYDIGDTVTCIKSNWGITLNTMIVGVNEIYEQQGNRLDIVVGNELPTLMKKIKRMR